MWDVINDVLSRTNENSIRSAGKRAPRFPSYAITRDDGGILLKYLLSASVLGKKHQIIS